MASTCSAEGYHYDALHLLEWVAQFEAASISKPLGIVPVALPAGTVPPLKIGFLGDVMPLKQQPSVVSDPVRQLIQGHRGGSEYSWGRRQSGSRRRLAMQSAS